MEATMRRLHWVALAAATAIVVACDAAAGTPDEQAPVAVGAASAGTGSKKVKSENRTVDPFERIQASGILQLTVTTGPAQSITVATDDNLMASVRTEIRSKTLYIDTTGDLHPSDGIRVTVALPALEDLRVAGTVVALVERRTQEDTDFNAMATGTSSIELSGVKAKALDVALSGTSTLTAKDFQCKSLHLVLDGTVTAKASGAADKVYVDMNGTSKADLLQVAAKEVSATLNGTNSADVNVSESLTVRATGASTVRYVGNPPKLSKDAPAPNEVRQK
jgi:hypothetical protein